MLPKELLTRDLPLRPLPLSLNPAIPPVSKKKHRAVAATVAAAVAKFVLKRGLLITNESFPR